ncbi:hypothetical protein LTR97_011164 [Elasticomyces elasticus]|uniref:HTH OST-type domain-containing protein n=1 Tax=Elasticomyces elasticus TaxID=574655 RepID=A0AAN7ZYS3_9PEZI|nr:hypothetical protein LTR97_011164 [Elasticomyces elasticus]
MAGGLNSFVALLIDGDNISPTIIPALVDKSATYGTLYTAVVCGNPKRLEQEDWKFCLQEYSMIGSLRFASHPPISIPHDMALELREGLPKDGAAVYTFGKRPRRIWPEDHRVNCVYFDELDVLPVTPAEPERPSHDLSSTTTGTPHQQPAASATVGATRHPTLALPRRTTLARPIDQATLEGLAMAILYSPVLEDGYHDLAPVGEFMRQVAKLDHRHYGYDRLRDMVEASGIADVKWPVLVRLKKDVAVEIKPPSAWTVSDDHDE